MAVVTNVAHYEMFIDGKHVHLDLTQTKDRHIFDIVLSTPAGEV